jgi:predicted ATPase
LLPEAEQHLLRHLGIFSGGFTFEAASAVMDDGVADPSDVMEGIANLVAKSMIALDRDTASRWYLLDTIRAYALDKLAGHGERNTAARRHGTYFRDVFASPAAGFRSRMSTEDLTHHGREINNVRAALDWAFSTHGDQAIGIDLTADYAPIWDESVAHGRMPRSVRASFTRR